MTTVTSSRLAELFSLEGLVVRQDLQQDKRAALLAVGKMFDDHQVPYVITGGIALQLYSEHIRATVDVDVVSLRDPFGRMKTAAPWERYGFELVFDRRRFIKLRHPASNVEVDINVDTRFASLLEGARREPLDDRSLSFCSPAGLAFTKLRTQRSDWPRDPIKRLQDRVDLMTLLRAQPGIAESLRRHPLTTDEMRAILDEVLRVIAQTTAEDFPPDEDEP